MEDIRSHEREYGHDIVQDRIRRESREVRHQKEGLVESGRVLCDYIIYGEQKRRE